MASYTRNEARDWAREHLQGVINVIIPSFTSDLLGVNEGQAPRFVKAYADLAGTIRQALLAYTADVRGRAFPEARHTYGLPAEELAAFEADLAARDAEALP